MDDNLTGGAAVLAGSVSLVVVAAVGVLWLDNAEGPMPEHPVGGGLLALVTAVLVGAAVLVLTWWLGRASRLLAVAAVLVVCVGGAVLLPRQVDVSESFVPRPNPRWDCHGWSFRHYPPHTFDASGSTYCVGVERRIADG